MTAPKVPSPLPGRTSMQSHTTPSLVPPIATMSRLPSPVKSPRADHVRGGGGGVGNRLLERPVAIPKHHVGVVVQSAEHNIEYSIIPEARGGAVKRRGRHCVRGTGPKSPVPIALQNLNAAAAEFQRVHNCQISDTIAVEVADDARVRISRSTGQ